MRRLISYQPQSTQKFLFNHYRIEEKFKVLNNNWDSIASLECKIILNKLDIKVTNPLLCAKKKYRKLRTRPVAYLLFLSKLRLKQYF